MSRPVSGHLTMTAPIGLSCLVLLARWIRQACENHLTQPRQERATRRIHRTRRSEASNTGQKFAGVRNQPRARTLCFLAPTRRLRRRYEVTAWISIPNESAPPIGRALVPFLLLYRRR